MAFAMHAFFDWETHLAEPNYALLQALSAAPTTASPSTVRQLVATACCWVRPLPFTGNDRFSTYAYYDGELFRTNYFSNNVSAGFRVTL